MIQNAHRFLALNCARANYQNIAASRHDAQPEGSSGHGNIKIPEKA
jgi:hypothetical protein